MEKSPSEIVKLTERISKDPKSKLFVPLAEEYKKIGDNEMAIHVLSEGLKQNPTYITARSLLGRLLFESGDLVAAQREFEEVVKAMPDNLLAHKKLGDVYVRQNKKSEALQQYQDVLKLSPGDKAVEALIAELEEQLRSETDTARRKEEPVSDSVSSGSTTTGKEGKAEQQGKASADSDIPQAPVSDVRPSEPTTLASSTAAAAEVIESMPTSESEPELPQQVASASPVESAIESFSQQEGAVVGGIELGGADLLTQEEPEEVIAFEPLEEEHPDQPAVKDELLVENPIELADEKAQFAAFSRESDREIATPEAEATSPQLSASQTSDEIVAAEDLDLFAETTAAPAHKQEEKGSEEAFLFSEPAGEKPAVSSEKEEAPPAESTPSKEQQDDFTTDTLAELYIAQGFYEKAIDIYSRMIADHPSSVGLRNKLERVKAMAAASEDTSAEATTVPPEEPPRSSSQSEETQLTPQVEEVVETLEEPGAVSEAAEHKGPSIATDEIKTEQEAPEKEEELTIDAEILLEPNADVQAETDIQTRNMGLEKELEASEPNLDKAEHDVFVVNQDDVFDEDVKRTYQDFEPKEYIPPDASLKTARPRTTPAVAASSMTSKKETIDRLEKWLSTIKKEK